MIMVTGRAREAVEQYFSENKVKIFMNRLDNSARAGIKFNFDDRFKKFF